MKIGTANIRNFPDMTPRQVAQDASTVAASCTLAGLQEIQPHEDTRVIENALGDDWWMVARGREVPVIGRNDRWRLLDHWVIPFHRPDLPRPQNVHGGVVSVVVRSVRKPQLPPFALVNTHLVSGAHNGPKLAALQPRYSVEWGMFRDEVLRLFRMGYTVFCVGDLNNPRPPRLTPRFAWLTPDGAPDHIGQLVHQHSVRLARPRHRRWSLNSDHALHVVSGPAKKAH